MSASEPTAVRTDAYARPSTTPRIKKEKYTLCAEWTMMPIQVLRKRHCFPISAAALTRAMFSIYANQIRQRLVMEVRNTNAAIMRCQSVSPFQESRPSPRRLSS
jgi:hypothetical protein